MPDCVIKPYNSDVDTDRNIPYHVRCAVDRDNNEIRICVVNTEGDILTIILTDVLPLLCHEKTEECCK